MRRAFKDIFMKSALAPVLLAGALVAAPLMQAIAPQPAFAQASGAIGTVADEANHSHLAFIRTGDIGLDRTTEAGLRGLSRILYERTGVENLYIERGAGDMHTNRVSTGPVQPRGITPGADDLSLYPFIYWAIDPGQPQLSGAAIEALNNYMRTGGMLFIDTRDQATGGRGQTWLQRAAARGLEIPALQRVEGCVDVMRACHVLGKAYYLLQDFPGRYTGAPLWAENTGLYREDGVATVIIGGNDWASAWATDADGRHMFAVIGTDPEQRERAYRAGINMVMYAFTGNYKADQVHIPAILDRMDPGNRTPRP